MNHGDWAFLGAVSLGVLAIVALVLVLAGDL